jgi:outer membrane immunogenic protein
MKRLLQYTIAALAISASGALAQAQNFAGFYGGLGATSSSVTLGVPAPAYSASAIGPSVLVGYNYAVSPNFILCAEATYAFGVATFPIAGISFKNEASLRLRGGYAINNTLIYGAAGYGISKLQPPGTSSNGQGWLVALGVEQMLTQNISARVEYSYAKYANFPTFGSGLEAVSNAITFGVVYHF